MANSSSSTTIPSESNDVISSLPPPSDCNTILISINTAAQAPLKLTPNNFLSWHAQWNGLLIGYNLKGYLDGSFPCPSAMVTENGIERLNPNYVTWVRQDQLLLSAIRASLSDKLHPFTASAKTSQEVWSRLSTTYAKPSRSRILRIKDNLNSPQAGRSITDYMQHVKSAADELSMIRTVPVEEEDLIFAILNDLDPEFKDISAAVRARDSDISFEDLHETLSEHEAFLKRCSTDIRHSNDASITANVASTAGYQSRNNNKTGRYNNSGHSNKQGHF